MHQQGKLHQTELRPLLALSRDLLQSDDALGTLKLVGKTMAQLLRIDQALLIMRTPDSEIVIGFASDGMAFHTGSRHPLYRIAHEVTDPSGLTPSMAHPSRTLGNVEFAAIPPASPTAVMAVAWGQTPFPRQASDRHRVLGYIAELAAAAMGKIEVRASLERLVGDLEQTVAGQRNELNDSASAYAREIARRDVAEVEMRILALTDVLTGMNNRRGFLLFGEQAFKSAHRLKQPAAVIFADVDGLKRVNDELGHDAGDQLLRDAATVFLGSFRQADIVGRMGGDEFAAFTMNDEQPDAVLARISRRLEEFNRNADRPYLLSFSTGVVSCDPESKFGLSDFLLLADQQMYAQKRALRH